MVNLSSALPPVIVQAPLTTSRNSTIDLIRTVACLGVIAIHVHSATPAAESVGLFFLNFCVPFFFATALTYFAQSLRPTIEVSATIKKVAKRIGIPFLVWSFIYAALLFIKSSVSGKPYSIDFLRVFLYGESAEHMYYLPELLTMQLLMLGIYLLANRIKTHIGFWLVVGPIAYLAWGYWNKYFGITPAKCIIVYLVAGFFIAPTIKNPTKKWLPLLIGFFLFILPLLVSGFGITNSLILNEYFFSLPLSGVGLLLIALNLPNIETPSWLAGITSATYGIYLSHVMFLEAFEFFAEKSHISIYYNLTNKLMISCAIFLTCTIFVLIVRKISRLRPVLLGEN